MDNFAVSLYAIAQKDRRVFEALFRGSSRKLTHYAKAILGQHSQEAEDIVDQAFLKIWKYAATFRGGNGEAFIRAIVRNAAFDHLRKHGKFHLEVDEATETQRIDDARVITPEEYFEKNSRAFELKEAMVRLSVEHREAVWLCYFEEMPLKAISELLECPENTVKTRLYHARLKLKQFLMENVDV